MTDMRCLSCLTEKTKTVNMHVGAYNISLARTSTLKPIFTITNINYISRLLKTA